MGNRRQKECDYMKFNTSFKKCMGKSTERWERGRRMAGRARGSKFEPRNGWNGCKLGTVTERRLYTETSRQDSSYPGFFRKPLRIDSGEEKVFKCLSVIGL